MATPTLSIGRKIAAGGCMAVLALGVSAGAAAAQDQHSGGVAPSNGSNDAGSPSAAAAPAAAAPAAAGGSALPVTGSDVAGLVLLGVGAVAVGSGAVAVSKRRTRLSV